MIFAMKDKTFITFETARLTLRPLHHDDAPHILALMQDPAWLQYIGDRGVHDLDSALAYIKNGPQAMYRECGFGMLAVITKPHQQFVGCCGLLKRDQLSHPDIGFAFNAQSRGQGFAFEAADVLLDAVGGANLWPHINALVTPSNSASIGLLQKLGFMFTQPLPDFEPDKDTHLYQLHFNSEKNHA